MGKHLHALEIGAEHTRVCSLRADGAPAQSVRRYDTVCRLSTAQIFLLSEYGMPDARVFERLGEIRIGSDPDLPEDMMAFRRFMVVPAEWNDPCVFSSNTANLPDHILQKITNGKILSCFVHALAEENGWSADALLAVILPDTPAWGSRQARSAFAARVREAADIDCAIPVSAARASACRFLTTQPQDVYAEKILVLHFGETGADAVRIENGHKTGVLTRPLASDLIPYLKKAAAGQGLGDWPADQVMQEAVFIMEWNGLPCRDTWNGFCRKFLAEAAEWSGAENAQMPGEGKRNTVILTGGAAAMPVIRKTCEEMFPAGVRILADPDPEDTACLGVSRFFFMDDKEYAEYVSFLRYSVGTRLHGYILLSGTFWEDDEINIISRPFRERITDTVFGTLCNQVMGKVEELAAQEKEWPKGMIEKQIRSAVYQNEKALQPAFEEACEKIGTEWKRAQCCEALKDVCRAVCPDMEPSFADAVFFPDSCFMTADAAFVLPGQYDDADSWSDWEGGPVIDMRDVFDADDLMKVLKIKASGPPGRKKVQPETLKECAENGRQLLEENKDFIMHHFLYEGRLLPLGQIEVLEAQLLDLVTLRCFENEKREETGGS